MDDHFNSIYMYKTHSTKNIKVANQLSYKKNISLHSWWFFGKSYSRTKAEQGRNREGEG